MLPHRYPFLLVDRVLECTPGETLTALKNVTINEPFFNGHFPGEPIMPGVLILEALAQACGILAIRTDNGQRRRGDQLLYFAGIDSARFKRPVRPGDQLMLHATLIKNRRDIWKFSVQATVDGELACQAEMMCALKDHDDAEAGA